MTLKYDLTKYIRSVPVIELCFNCSRIKYQNKWVEYDGNFPDWAIDKMTSTACDGCWEDYCQERWGRPLHET
jgi:hypothetical protein